MTDMTSNDPQHPNIITIVSDDLGHWCLGNHEVQTPTLDRLTTEGAHLDNFFCVSPVCSPARASLLTGELPSRHGVHDAIQHGEHPNDPIDYLAGYSTYVDDLAAGGYSCSHVGKWHLGNAGSRPQAFTQWCALAHQGMPYNDPLITRGDGRIVRRTGYTTDIITDEALTALEAEADGDHPFFLSVCYTAPHAPWLDQHPQHLLDIYADCPFDTAPQEPEHPWSWGFRTSDGRPSRISPAVDLAFERPRETRQAYFASVTGMDRGIGRILDHVEQMGTAESTIVVFLSDNGFSGGHHGIWGKGNGTYPLNVYDSAVKVPGVFWQPGRIAAGTRVDGLVSGYDVRPTLLDLAGLVDPGAEERPGRSFRAALEGTVEGGDERVVVFDEYGPVRMIRTREWKYVDRHPDGPRELYSLVEDPAERTNLVDDPRRAPQAALLHEELDAWFEKWTDPDVDGRTLPVHGLGQTGRVMAGSRAADLFNQVRVSPPPD